MNGLIMELKLRRAEYNRERQERGREPARRQHLAVICGEVAGWRPASVVEPGWRTANADDTVVQLAWAVRELRAAVAGCGLVGKLEELVTKTSEPAGCYAGGLLRLAGEECKRQELEDRVRDAWADPTVWREVARWFGGLSDRLYQGKSAEAAPAADRSPHPKRGRRAGATRADREPTSATSHRDQSPPRPTAHRPTQADDHGRGGATVAPEVPEEVSTAAAAKLLGVSRDTVLKYREKGLLRYRDLSPPGSSRPNYAFPLAAVLELRTGYEVESPAPPRPVEPTRRRARGQRRYKHLDIDD